MWFCSLQPVFGNTGDERCCRDAGASILVMLGIGCSCWHRACIWVAVPQASSARTNAVQSLWKSFLGCAAACSAVAHRKQNTYRSGQLVFGFFAGQRYLEMDALLMIFSQGVPDFRMIAKFIAFPLFIVPRVVTLGALLCCAQGRLGSGLPSLWESPSFSGSSYLGFAWPTPLRCYR